MKKALPIALSILVFSVGASFATPPNAVHHAASVDTYTLETLPEADVDSVNGARTVCTGDLLTAQHHLAAGNLGQAAFWLLVAHLRPVLCS